MSELKTVPRKRRKIRFVHILLLLFIAALGVFVFFRFNTKRQLRSRIEAFRAEGYPVTWEELDKYYSIPDDAENAAYIILNAIGYYHEPNDFNRIPVIVKANIPAHGERLPDDVLKSISTYISENKQSLDELHKISFLEYGRYPFDLSLGVNTRLDHFQGVRHCFILLQSEAIYTVENKDVNQVMSSIRSMFGIARSFEAEPLYISQMVRINYNSMVVSILEYIMSRIDFNEEQLIDLDRLLKEAEDSSGIKRAYASERCIRLRFYENPAVFSRDILEGGLPAQPVLEVCKALGILDRAALVYLRFDKEFTDAFELPLHKQTEAFKAIEAELNKSKLPGFLRLKQSQFGELVSLNIKTIAQLRTAQAALAVERYRLTNNKLPESLAELVPDYLESIPSDPFDGKELRYKKLDPGFVIYSVGEDLKDDGDKERLKDKKESVGNTYDVTFIIEK